VEIRRRWNSCVLSISVLWVTLALRVNQNCGLSDYLYHVSFGSYRPLKLPLSCKIANKVVFGARFVGEEYLPQISDMHFQIALTSEHMADFSWVPFSERGWLITGWRKRRRRIAVKPKYPDKYVGWPGHLNEWRCVCKNIISGYNPEQGLTYCYAAACLWKCQCWVIIYGSRQVVVAPGI